MEARLFNHLLRRFQRLLSYPQPGYAETAAALQRALGLRHPEAAVRLADFVEFAASRSTAELEETFTQSFELNPACALEVGWHLFGEEYARGLFLVRMRQELRRYGLDEDRELPDHITHVLALLAAMPPQAAESFIRSCVWPALGRMQRALDKAGSPYEELLAALCLGLQQAFDLQDVPQEHEAAQESELTAADAEWDAAQPVPAGCGGSAAQTVELELQYAVSPSAETDVAQLLL